MRTLRKYSKFILLLGLPFWLYACGGGGWWTSSIGDNASTLVYSETIDAYLFTPDTFTIAIQAWPSWTGSADYRLTIRPAP